MTRRLVFSPRAQQDIDDIWAYTAGRWNVDQAATYTLEIARQAAVLADNPAIGRACPDIRAGYSRLRCGSHFLFYRWTYDDLVVIRILHASMDHERHL